MTKLDQIVHHCVSTLAALLVGAGVANGHPAAATRGWPADRPRTNRARRRLGQFLQPDRRGPRRGRRVLPRRHRLRGAGRARERGRELAAPRDVRLPRRRVRLQIGHCAATPGGVKISSFHGDLELQPFLERRMKDPGAVMLMVVVREIDAPLARLKELGAPVVTTGGAPVNVGGQVLGGRGQGSGRALRRARAARRDAAGTGGLEREYRRRQSAAHGREPRALPRALS